MPNSETLKRIKEDIAAGNLGMARERLHTLVYRYPEDLSLRKQLGDIYSRLQYPARAGCFWYLEKHKSAKMEDACNTFVRANGGDPRRILHSLKFRIHPDALPAGFARDTLLGLHNQAPGYKFPFSPEANGALGKPGIGEQARDLIRLVGCGCAVFACGMIFVFGVITLVMFARGYDFRKP